MSITSQPNQERQNKILNKRIKMKQFISVRTGDNMAEAFLIWRVLSLGFRGGVTNETMRLC